MEMHKKRRALATLHFLLVEGTLNEAWLVSLPGKCRVDKLFDWLMKVLRLFCARVSFSSFFFLYGVHLFGQYLRSGRPKSEGLEKIVIIESIKYDSTLRWEERFRVQLPK